MNQPDITTRRSSVITTLGRYGITPSFPPTDPTNLAEGVDGDCLCPFAHMHTKPETDLSKPTVRIWLDRPDGNRPELGGKVYMSCRHMSCQDALWQEVTLPARKSLPRQVGGKRPIPVPPNPELKAMQDKKIKGALAGKEFTNQILNDPTTLSATEDMIFNLSPLPLRTKSGIERPPLIQLSLFLSLFHPDDLIYMGDTEDAKDANHIRTQAQWNQWIDNFLRSPIAGEDPTTWPWPGRFTTSSTFKTSDGGRNNENQLLRRFVVCESDSLGKKEQLRVIKALIEDPRFKVAYVLHTGSKSYHIGLSIPEPTELELAFLAGIPGSQAPKELIKTRRPERFGGMGFDAATVRKVQPVRIPGPINPRTGRPQRLLYIDPSLGYESSPATEA